MKLNNAPIILSLAGQLDSQVVIQTPVPRQRDLTGPCLPSRLPSTGFLEREAQQDAPKAVLRQLRRSPTPPQSPTAEDEVTPPSPKQNDSASSPPSASPTQSTFRFNFPFKSAKPQGAWKEPQPFEIFRAVEQKDIMFLMEVRDRAFQLLVRKTGDATPLLHAMRIGQSHRDVAIILLGAFSRWINHLEDSEIPLPRTKAILKALRTNLKLAIDYGLQKSQSDLAASFLQTLIMSEGDKWVWAQSSSVSLALRAGTAGKPVSTAELAVRKFATKELGKADAIAALEDYVANATADLLMLGAWSMALQSIEGESIPSYYFARDDRIYKAFVERLESHKSAIHKSLSKRLKWQLRVLQRVLEGRTTTYRSKVELLVGELDEGEGV
ncbi:hypothetical protein SERLA73DRAFT_178937 [Serpula lacrymans var. lacrymans S7.3]|uniref:Uncharacterized protein n=2 Tax=Serpula lacrymans var. lacrymans TaxID=341189 RepID=F8PTA1_SERL3|nr:uncharacterized protein SERLADRAFT_463732 [Serpula lacrymans var. lacrymans S7.9]EGO00931.1 hypothetical protein SERLA73DRAFT_178937 [Serpula lacrymans var. lacrymans S7.3]EGO26551.1 hypothetical protein SERLADRAFT_463732 [Serpula lacrymans var. lacrymans S7.9]